MPQKMAWAFRCVRSPLLSRCFRPIYGGPEEEFISRRPSFPGGDLRDRVPPARLGGLPEDRLSRRLGTKFARRETLRAVVRWF